MAVKFFSVRSGEIVVAETEPMIAAYFNSSDLNPNGIVQDYGWRIHPEMVKRIRELEEDEDFIRKLAKDLEIPEERVATYHILKYLSDREDRAKRKADKVRDNKFQEQYDRELNEALAAADEQEPAKAKSKGAKPKVATAAEIAAQKKLDDDKLAKMIADDDKK